MDKKVLYVDVETTGTDSSRNGIIQLACILIVDGLEVANTNLFMRPPLHCEVSPEALAIHGYSQNDIGNFDLDHSQAYREFIKLLDEHIERFDKRDKVYFAGFNAHFDYSFVRQWALYNNDPYIGSYFNNRILDPLPLLHLLDFLGDISLPNYKLATVCEYFDIPLQGHDALVDIRATRDVLTRVTNRVLSFADATGESMSGPVPDPEPQASEQDEAAIQDQTIAEADFALDEHPAPDFSKGEQ